MFRRKIISSMVIILLFTGNLFGEEIPGLEDGRHFIDTAIGDENFAGHSNNLPDTPFAISPENGAVFVEGPVRLQAGPFSDPEENDHIETRWLVRRSDRPYNSPENDSSFEHVAISGDLTTHVVQGLYPGLEYVWKVGYKDEGSRYISWSEEYRFRIGVSQTNEVAQIEPGEKESDYQVISFFVWPDNPSCEAVFEDNMPHGYNQENFRIGTYNPLIGRYTECGAGMSIRPGKAYWILTRERLHITITGVPAATDQDIDVGLIYNPNTGDGWNMIASPNNASYLWNNIKVIAYDREGRIFFGPESVSELSDSNPYIDKNLWRWENGDYISEDTGRIESGKGYWVKTKQERVFLRFGFETRNSEIETRTSSMRSSDDDCDCDDDDDSPPRPMDGEGLYVRIEDGSVSVDASQGCFIGVLTGSE